MNNLPRDKQVDIIAALCEGVSVRAAARLTDTNRKTVGRLALQVGAPCPSQPFRSLVADGVVITGISGGCKLGVRMFDPISVELREQAGADGEFAALAPLAHMTYLPPPAGPRCRSRSGTATAIRLRRMT